MKNRINSKFKFSFSSLSFQILPQHKIIIIATTTYGLIGLLIALILGGIATINPIKPSYDLVIDGQKKIFFNSFSIRTGVDFAWGNFVFVLAISLITYFVIKHRAKKSTSLVSSSNEFVYAFKQSILFFGIPLILGILEILITIFAFYEPTLNNLNKLAKL